MRKAPWPDFRGNPIHEGDAIIHPSGETGTVVFLSRQPPPPDQWRVDYRAEYLSHLCLQLGDKGEAEVVNPTNRRHAMQRYDIGMIEDSEGLYVEYSVAAALAARVAELEPQAPSALKAKLESAERRIAELEEENAILKMQHDADASAIGQMARKALKR